MIDRRSLMILSLVAGAGRAQADSPRAPLGPPVPVTFETLVEEARSASRQPFVERPSGPAAILDSIDYGSHTALRMPLSKALYRESGYPVTFFHLGQFFRKPVRIHAWDGREAREVVYSKAMFDPPSGNPASAMPDGAGFAGFRVHEVPPGPSVETAVDWLAFLGGSYFRACGESGQYGLSGRGIAVDTAPAPGRTESFPDFTRFYIAPLQDGRMDILAYLDGEAVVGAYRFSVSPPRGIATKVECVLFPRRAIQRFGIAPLTSMYWFSETNKWVSPDTRQEVHDSDGLAILTGASEFLWRPLNNPPHLAVSAFADKSPKGFGLLQRDRLFDHYHDEAAYERRPNAWVEPLGDWGSGSVQLVEIPSIRETDDNIVAMWVPAEPVVPGNEYRFAYRVLWTTGDPLPPPLARCVATRMDKGVRVNLADGKKAIERQFIVEIEGEALRGLDARQAECVLTLSRGTYKELAAWPFANGDPSPWRVFFKIVASGGEPLEARLTVRNGGRPLSETVLLQYYPEHLVLD